MKRHLHTFTRVARGLKLATLLLCAIVTYAALLKKGRANARTFGLLVALGLGSAVLSLMPVPAPAKAPARPAKLAPQGPPKQIFTRSDKTGRSDILGCDGKAAYIVSALGTNSGTLITSISSGSLAAKFGVSEGDVLLSINQRVVTTARDADRILGDIPSGTIRVAFAHPSDNGLQLYNANFPYTHQGPPSGASAYIASGSGSGKSAAQLAAQIPAAESHMLSVVNADRAKEKAPPVDSSSALASLARAHAQDMAARKFFAHVNPDGLSPADRARNAGLGSVFENISFANGVSDLNSAAEDSERQMMSEPPDQQNHRSNIIDPNHKTVGIGIAVAKDGRYYMVQEFSNGSP